MCPNANHHILEQMKDSVFRFTMKIMCFLLNGAVIYINNFSFNNNDNPLFYIQNGYFQGIKRLIWFNYLYGFIY